MAYLNKVFLIGNLTRDPEKTFTRSNTPICKASIAVSRKVKDRTETAFIDITAWDKVADVLCNYCKKGSPIMVEGRLTLDQWKDKEGNNRSKLSVTVENMQMLGSKEETQEEPF